MRLISQDRTIDIPYDKVAIVARGDNTIIAYGADDNSYDNFWMMGAYSTCKKAMKVMREIGESQCEDRAYFLFPKN